MEIDQSHGTGEYTPAVLNDIVNGDDSNDDDVNADRTVQEKNITFPTDAKLHKKIIKKTLKIVQDEQFPIRQSYHPNAKKTLR